MQQTPDGDAWLSDGDINTGSDDSTMPTEERNLSWSGAKASLT